MPKDIYQFEYSQRALSIENLCFFFSSFISIFVLSVRSFRLMACSFKTIQYFPNFQQVFRYIEKCELHPGCNYFLLTRCFVSIAFILTFLESFISSSSLRSDLMQIKIPCFQDRTFDTLSCAIIVSFHAALIVVYYFHALQVFHSKWNFIITFSDLICASADVYGSLFRTSKVRRLIQRERTIKKRLQLNLVADTYPDKIIVSNSFYLFGI